MYPDIATTFTSTEGAVDRASTAAGNTAMRSVLTLIAGAFIFVIFVPMASIANFANFDVGPWIG